MASVDPFVIPIPRQFLEEQETREFFEYFVRWAHDLWVRTGGGTDEIESADVREKYAWVLGQLSEPRINTVSASSNYTALDYDFVNATSSATITLPLYPADGAFVIIRNGDGTRIGLDGNGRNINGSSTGSLARKGTAIELYYFIDDNEWFAR